MLTDENTPETELIKLLESRKKHAWSLHKIQLEIDMYDVMEIRMKSLKKAVLTI